jgi:hypothetical protein
VIGLGGSNRIPHIPRYSPCSIIHPGAGATEIGADRDD